MIPSLKRLPQSLKVLHGWMLAPAMRNQEYLHFFKLCNHKDFLEWGCLPIGSAKLAMRLETERMPNPQHPTGEIRLPPNRMLRTSTWWEYNYANRESKS
jgi:hypothetical protein